MEMLGKTEQIIEPNHCNSLPQRIVEELFKLAIYVTSLLLAVNKRCSLVAPGTGSTAV
jgi:hypothetical protein